MNATSYRVKQPIFFHVIVIVKTKTYFVNLSNIFAETNLRKNFTHNIEYWPAYLYVNKYNARLTLELT